MSKIRILLVDDHAVLRAGIHVLLETQPDLEIIGEAGDGREAVMRARELQPDVALLDIAMPGLDGLTAAREIKAACPNTRILFLTQHENKEYVLPALKLGTSGYVLKRAEGDELITAIRTVYAGGTFLDPAIAGAVVGEATRDPSAEADPFDSLTEREREVLVMLAQGKTYQQIAEILFISPKTVDYHRTNLMHKLGLTNRAELTRFALRRGL
ncbi:MAG: response regulator transcription factor [Chloroflexi bacterium]|nr:response regulator transcription factor [Chloroflexota bacterium]